MAKMEFDKYKGNAEHIQHEIGSGKKFNEKQGGDIDPFGDEEKKEKDAIDMNAGEAFNKADYTKVEAMGTDYPKKGNFGQKMENKGDHFKVEEVDAYGNDEAKKDSFHTIKRK